MLRKRAKINQNKDQPFLARKKTLMMNHQKAAMKKTTMTKMATRRRPKQRRPKRKRRKVMMTLMKMRKRLVRITRLKREPRRRVKDLMEWKMTVLKRKKKLNSKLMRSFTLNLLPLKLICTII